METQLPDAYALLLADLRALKADFALLQERVQERRRLAGPRRSFQGEGAAAAADELGHRPVHGRTLDVTGSHQRPPPPTERGRTGPRGAATGRFEIRPGAPTLEPPTVAQALRNSATTYLEPMRAMVASSP